MLRALDDVRILDLTHIVNGPYATLMLSFLGADVIKLEPPGQGEKARALLPIRGVAHESFPFIMLNSNKRSITLNLKTERGKDLFRQLIPQVDVVVENFALGVMDKLGLGYEVLKQLNPRLVYAASTGYGRNGPYSDYPAFDSIIQAMSGLMSSTGDPDGPPMKAGPPVMDVLGGIHLATGVLGALRQRDRTGQGLFVETSLYDAALGPMIAQIATFISQDGTYQREGNAAPNRRISPYNCYPTKDGHVFLLTLDDQRWRALCRLMDCPELADDARFVTNRDRRKHAAEVDALVSAWTLRNGKQDIMERCSAADITCGVVKDIGEIITDPHIRARGRLQDIEHPTAGKMVVLGSPWWIDDKPLGIDAPSPSLGQHNELVYGELLGLSAQEIAQLKEQEVI